MIKQVPDSKLIEIDENGNLRRDGVPAMGAQQSGSAGTFRRRSSCF